MKVCSDYVHKKPIYLKPFSAGNVIVDSVAVQRWGVGRRKVTLMPILMLVLEPIQLKTFLAVTNAGNGELDLWTKNKLAPFGKFVKLLNSNCNLRHN